MENPETCNDSTVYLDKLGLGVFIQLLNYKGLKKIYCLDSPKLLDKFYKCLLQFRGVEVTEASFFTGHLKTQNGECVYLAARRFAARTAFASSQIIVTADPTLKSLNSSYGRNTIQLFIAKQLIRYIEWWTLRILVAEAISKSSNPVILLKKPARFPEKILLEFIPEIRLSFYSAQLEHALDLGKILATDFFRFIKLVIYGFFFRHDLPNKIKPGVLMLQEETVRGHNFLRNQLHWFNFESRSSAFETYVLKLPSLFKSESGVENELSQKGITLLPLAYLGNAWRAMRGDKVFFELRHDRIRAYMAVLSANTSSGRFFLAKVGFLLWQSELMGAISKALGVRVFVTKEPHNVYTDAIQLCAERLSIRTIAIQYSNMGFLSPGMLTTADRFLSFSDMYKQVFTCPDFMPKEYLSVGYLYDGIVQLVRERAVSHRSQLQAKGATFIVCYFDESVQHDRWGLVSKEDHLDELHCLTLRVLQDHTFGVVIKSQFIKNSPSMLYPDDELIQKAQATGRYLELKEGQHRNDIYPTEAALASDLCIGHKFGATAALEAALAGIRTVILDSYGTNTQWDALYASVNIEFPNIEKAIDASFKYRHGDASQQDLGDWTPILSHFVCRGDSKAVEFTANLIAEFATNPPDEIIS